MKKIRFLTVSLIGFCFLFVFPVDSQADAYNEFRNRCTVFTKRYKSFARTQGNDAIDIFPCKSQFSNCISTQVGCSSNDRDTGRDTICAGAAARASDTENFIDIFSVRGCTAGLGISDLSKELGVKNITPKSTFPQICKIQYGQTLDIENSTYKIYNTNGFISIDKSYSGYVEVKFTLWRAFDDYINQIEDENMTPDKILFEEYIRIRNNRVEISAGLKGNKAIKITETLNSIQVELVNFEHTFNIPTEIDIDNELVARVSGFNEFDEERFLEEELKKSSKSSAFTISPNPTRGAFVISTPSLAFDQIVEVRLYSIKGGYLRTLYRGSFYKDEVSLVELQVNDLSDGVYTLTIIGEGFVETKKLVISRAN